MAEDTGEASAYGWQVFELGDRTVTAYHCPGHTFGEMVFLDDKTKTLLLGDACNCNYYLAVPERDGKKNGSGKRRQVLNVCVP